MWTVMNSSTLSVFLQGQIEKNWKERSVLSVQTMFLTNYSLLISQWMSAHKTKSKERVMMIIITLVTCFSRSNHTDDDLVPFELSTTREYCIVSPNIEYNVYHMMNMVFLIHIWMDQRMDGWNSSVTYVVVVIWPIFILQVPYWVDAIFVQK